MTDSAQRRRVVFIIGGHWIAGPVTFLRAACGNLTAYGWNPLLLLTGPAQTNSFNDWPCAVLQLPRCHSYAQLAHQAAHAIQQNRTDIVVATDDNTSAVAMQHLYKDFDCSVRLLEMLHADLPSEYDRVARLTPILTAVCGINDSVVSELRGRIPALRHRIFRWFNPVPCAPDPPSSRLSRPVKLVYVGRVFQREKRALDLVEIGNRLVARALDFQLTIVGDGEVMSNLRERLDRNPEVKRRTVLTGWLPTEAIPDLLAGQDLFLLPGDRESMGFSLLEAMGQGVVPIITPLPGPSEVVDQETGFTVPVGDFEGFADAVATAIADPERLHQMRIAAYERVRRKFDVPVAVKAFANILDQTMALSLPEGRDKFRAPRPLGRMDRLGIPQSVQHAKRRLFGQFITP